MNKLPVLSLENLHQIGPDHYELSLYNDPLTTKGIVDNIRRIKSAFPDLPAEFYDVFTDMIQQDKFTDARLKDAVNHVIRTCIYPRPTIAQFISYDKRKKVFNYLDMCKKVDEYGGKIWVHFYMIDLPDGKKGWLEKNHEQN